MYSLDHLDVQLKNESVLCRDRIIMLLCFKLLPIDLHQLHCNSPANVYSTPCITDSVTEVVILPA